MSERPSAHARLLAAVALVLWGGNAAPGRQETDLEERARALGQEALQQGADGLALAVDLEGELILARGFGFTDGTRATPASAEAPFRVGALLPSFLAVAALQLAEQAKLDLAAPISELVPGLAYGERVRVDMLLTHTSGIPAYPARRGAGGGVRPFDPDAVLAWLGDGPLESEPGSCASYSATNDFLLGLALERASGRSVKELLEEGIFARAGMEDTSWCLERPAPSAAGATEQDFAGEHSERGNAPPPWDAEGLCSTALDLVRFQRALVDGRLLGEDWLARRALPARLPDGTEVACGRGLSLEFLADLPRESAGGTLAGDQVELDYYPGLDATLVLVASGHDAPLEPAAARLARALFAREQPTVRDRPLAPERAARYLGDYYAGCTSYGIALDGDHLALYPPGGRKRRLLYQGGEAFAAADDPDLRLVFEIEDERAVALLLTERGITLRAKRAY